jgi:hypothetical protein
MEMGLDVNRLMDVISNIYTSLESNFADLILGFIYGSVLFFIGIFIGTMFLLWLREFLNGKSIRESIHLSMTASLENLPKVVLVFITCGYFWIKLIQFNPAIERAIIGGVSEAALSGQAFGATAMGFWYLSRKSGSTLITDFDAPTRHTTKPAKEINLIDLGKPIGKMDRAEIQAAADKIVKSALEQAKKYKKNNGDTNVT